MCLAQLVGIKHNICKVRGLKSLPPPEIIVLITSKPKTNQFYLIFLNKFLALNRSLPFSILILILNHSYKNNERTTRQTIIQTSHEC